MRGATVAQAIIIKETQITDLWVRMRSERVSHKASIGMQERRFMRSVHFVLRNKIPSGFMVVSDQDVIDILHVHACPDQMVFWAASLSDDS